MPDVIKFRNPVNVKEGETEFRLRTLMVDAMVPLVKMLLQQVDSKGAFVENGETVSVRHEGAAADAFLTNPMYRSVLESLPTALVQGNSLPQAADIVQVSEDPTVPPVEPAPVEPVPEEPIP